jgi:dTDP-3,4-didehydro-2,6-dideoxy-alpha-D-glucose 3-reductase
VPRAASQGPSQAAPGAVRLGVLGADGIARARMLPALARVSSIETVAIAGHDLSTAEELTAQFGGVPVDGYRALLERDDIEAVYVPLPTGLHLDWVTRALRAGKHVLCEKPLTASAADSARLLDLAAGLGLVLMENLMFLHHSQHAAVRTLVSSGVIGAPRAFGSACGFPPPPAGDVRYRRELGGGVLLDAAVYPLRAAQYFLGAELELVGACLAEHPATGVDVSGSALLRTPDGASAQVSFGFEHSYRCQYEIWGRDGRIVLDRAFTPPESWRPVVRIERQDHVEERVLPADDQFANVATAFADAVRTGRRPDGDAVVRLAALVDLIRTTAVRSRSSHVEESL